MAAEKVIQFRDFERGKADADADRARDPDGCAVIIVMPVVRIERYDGAPARSLKSRGRERRGGNFKVTER